MSYLTCLVTVNMYREVASVAFHGKEFLIIVHLVSCFVTLLCVICRINFEIIKKDQSNPRLHF